MRLFCATHSYLYSSKKTILTVFLYSWQKSENLLDFDVYNAEACQIFSPASHFKGIYGLIIMRNEQFSPMGFSPHLKK